MSSRLVWEDGAFPHPSKSRVPIERFLTKVRRTIWLLGDLTVRGSHFRQGESSKPCLLPEPCPLCDELGWKAQIEGYFPCLIKRKTKDFWDPCIAVLTAGALKDLPVGGYRGRILDLWREVKGSAKILKFEESPRPVEPPAASFDVRPHLTQLWFPLDKVPRPNDVPDPIEIQPERTYQPEKVSAEELEFNRAYIHATITAVKAGKKHPTPEQFMAEWQNREKRDSSHDLPSGRPAARPEPEKPAGATILAAPADVFPASEPDFGIGNLNSALDELLTKTTGRMTCEELQDRLPANHPAKRASTTPAIANGKHTNGHAKGGAK